MALWRLLALTIALTGLSGCPSTVLPFRHVNLAQAQQAPEPAIIVGRKVVVRLESGDRPRFMRLDLFPAEATLRGAWVRIVKGGLLYEGSAGIFRWQETQHLTVRWDHPEAFRPVRTVPLLDSATVWLGPICVEGDCETIRIDEATWPTPPPLF